MPADISAMCGNKDKRQQHAVAHAGICKPTARQGDPTLLARKLLAHCLMCTGSACACPVPSSCAAARAALHGALAQYGEAACTARASAVRTLLLGRLHAAGHAQGGKSDTQQQHCAFGEEVRVSWAQRTPQLHAVRTALSWC